jgi:tRNA-binding protein
VHVPLPSAPIFARDESSTEFANRPSMSAMKPTVTYADFEKLDIRAGRVVAVEAFPAARKPAYKMTIDFGAEVGIKRSSAQITEQYAMEALVGKVVIGVVNFAPKRIADFTSEALVLGVADDDGHVVLLSPDFNVPIGGPVY